MNAVYSYFIPLYQMLPNYPRVGVLNSRLLYLFIYSLILKQYVENSFLWFDINYISTSYLADVGAPCQHGVDSKVYMYGSIETYLNLMEKLAKKDSMTPFPG